MTSIVALLLVVGMIIGYSLAQITLERPVCKKSMAVATMGIRG